MMTLRRSLVCASTLLALLHRFAVAATSSDPSSFTTEAKAQLLTDLIAHHVDDNNLFGEDYRQLIATASDHRCGQVLKNYEAETIRNVLSESLAVGEGPDLTESQSSLIGNILLPLFRYDVQIRKVCGRASDYPDVATALCPISAGEIGCDSMQSGILILPMEKGAIKQGTLAGTFAFHGYLSNSHAVPSNINFKEGSQRGPMGTTAMLLTSLIGTAVIMPDYLGGGEEAGKTFRPFLKRDTYPVSAMALLSAAEELITKESNCVSAIDDAFYMIGHLEGGYAAVAVADALVNRLKKSIYWASTSHAPFRPASAQMNFFAQQELDGTLNANTRYMIYRLGATYSPQNEVDAMGADDVNEISQQSLLTTDSSLEVQALLLSDFVQDDIDSFIEDDHPLQNSWNPAFVAAMEQALVQGLSGPCDPSLVDDETSFLCESLMAQDLTDVIERITFPTTLCHSPESDVVSFDNLPSKDRLSEDTMIASPKQATLAACLQGLLIFAAGTMLQSFDATYVPVREKTTPAGLCHAVV